MRTAYWASLTVSSPTIISPRRRRAASPAFVSISTIARLSIGRPIAPGGFHSSAVALVGPAEADTESRRGVEHRSIPGRAEGPRDLDRLVRQLLGSVEGPVDHQALGEGRDDGRPLEARLGRDEVDGSLERSEGPGP